MGSIENISELCRLCLVKDQVNVPIFEENATKEQTFVKINSCLPVKVSRDDSLPKKICDGCSCKLDMLYTFRNTSVDSEKQLLKWLNQAGLSCSQSAVKDPLASTKPEVTIKQETFEPTDSRDDLGLDTHSYIMQQQKLPYSQEFEFGEPSESNVGLMTDEPAPKKAKRAAALNKASVETDEDDLDAAMQITKAEDEDSDEIDQPEYVEAPSTSADDQPGPSGVNKTTVEAPFKYRLVNKNGRWVYTCDFCTSSYAKLEALLMHRETHTNPNFIMMVMPKEENFLPNEMKMTGPWPCDLCSRVYKYESHLSNHRLRHFAPRIKQLFSCDLCHRSYKFQSQLNIHRRRHFEPKIKCPQCDKHLYDNYTLKEHISQHHENRRFICDICQHAAPTKSILRLHIVAKHTKVYPFRCELCGEGYAKKWSLDIHHKSVHEGTRYVCEFCKKVFKYEAGLRSHVKIHDPNQAKAGFTCDICSKVIQTARDFDRHVKSHHGQREGQMCDVCGKSYAKLAVHMQSHTGLKTHICEVCGKAFARNQALQSHMLTHNGEKPHKCGVCGKGHNTKPALKVHMRKHTGERPYKCSVCLAEFISGSRLTQHKCKPVVD
nr:PREDICTED: zinc finger protein 708 isoform X6 [Tribolium castaneum]|eukprot:XP_015834120.1 PREDICTED: zinc finger protein 708 isoform X6 [Tribolium castaneum]